jgi:hypothetical protein
MGLHANKDRVIQEPSASWLEHVTGTFEAPPVSTQDLVLRMVSSQKELAREAISLTAVIGSLVSILTIWPESITSLQHVLFVRYNPINNKK